MAVVTWRTQAALPVTWRSGVTFGSERHGGGLAVLFSAPPIPVGVTGLRRSPQEWDRSPQEWDRSPQD